MYSEIPSPAKKQSVKKQRLKQLTMSQAFSRAPSSKVVTEQVNDLDETCLQTDQFDSPKCSFVSGGNLVKNEPMEIEMETNVLVPKLSSVNISKSNLRQVKPEPTVRDEEITSPAMSLNCKQLEQTNETMMSPQDEGDSNTEFFADFDKVPKKKDDGPGFKHVTVVRNQNERKKLGTSSCKECENYWNSLPEGQRPKRMDDMCRHRSKYQAPDTPEHYWSISFPNTQDCIERGYGGVLVENDRDDASLAKRPRRKRPLKIASENKKKKMSDGGGQQEENGSDFDFGETD